MDVAANMAVALWSAAAAAAATAEATAAEDEDEETDGGDEADDAEDPVEFRRSDEEAAEVVGRTDVGSLPYLTVVVLVETLR